MLKRILTVMFAVMMLFSFTACNLSPEALGALIGIIGGVSGEQQVPDRPYEEEEGVIGMIPGGDGDIYVEIDPEGNVLENGNIIVYKDLVAEHFIGLTLRELKDFAGYDLRYTEDWLYGASRGAYYADGRIPATFYFTDDLYRDPEEYTGDETILFVAIAGNTIAPCEVLSGDETFDFLTSSWGCQLHENIELSGNSTTIHLDDRYITYTWFDGTDPFQNTADLIEVGRAY